VPALNARVINYMGAGISTTDQIIAAQETLCGPFRQTEIKLGNAIFPGDTERLTDIVRIRKEDVDRGIRANELLWPNDSEGLAKWKGKIAPSLITCIDYRESLSPAKHHQTQYYSLIGPRTDEFSMVIALAPVGVIEQTKLWRMFMASTPTRTTA
jgi:hypothetical protein